MKPDRFKPVRAGIIGIWDYSEQEFRFADGRLVLRGPNGSGKTKALEVLVPFVLDGSIDARRLDPFSGKQRTMKSNLLYGGQKVGHGYCWLELARGDEHVTIGVGMRAQEQSPRVKTWFFVADGVVGESIHLLSPSRVPLGMRELREQLGPARVFERRDDHQAAVDRRLFGLGLERYRAMLELVLTLRRPQLAKDLDPDALSDVLSDGLRTVDSELLKSSAQAFDNLESAQRDLSELERAHDAVDELLSRWRGYLRARGAKRVEEVAEKAARVRRTEQKITELELHIRRQARAAQAATQRLRDHESALRRLDAEVTGLKESRAYRDQHQLDDARQGVLDAERALGRAHESCRRARLAHEQADRTQALKRERLTAAHAAAEAARSELRAHLRLAQLPAEGALDLDSLRADTVARRASVDAVSERVADFERSERDLGRAESHLQRAIADLEVAEAGIAQARGQVGTLLAEAEQTLRTWHGQLPAPLCEAAALPPLLELLPELGGEADLEGAVREALSSTREALIIRRSALTAARDGRAAEIARCLQDIADIREQREDSPIAPLTRRAARAARPGAPLWRLVRFRGAVQARERAGLEGALLAAGLLDAWVSPGADSDDALEDLYLRRRLPAAAPTLAEVLEPEGGAEVPGEKLRAILSSISLVEADVAALPSGRFCLGPLTGAYRADQARYIGATARARHRIERIKILEAERAKHEAARAHAESERAEIVALIDAVARAPLGLPSAQPLRQARAALHGALGSQTQAGRAHARALRDRGGAQRVRDEARRLLRGAAAEHGVPATAVELRALGQHLRGADGALTALEVREARRGERQQELDEAVEATIQAGEAQAETERGARDAAAIHEQRGARFQALEASLGVAVRQILDRLDTLEDQRAVEDTQRGRASRDREAAERGKASFIGELNALQKQLPDQRLDLAHSEAALAPFQLPIVQAALQLPQTDEPFSARLAAAVEGAVFSTEQLKTTETRLGLRLEGLDQALGSRFHSVRRTSDGITTVEIQDELGSHGLSVFSKRLAERLQFARALLAREEQKLFEDQLLGNLCAQMRERIEETRALVRLMDEAMRARQLASRKSLGVAWRPAADAPTERSELLKLLQYDALFLTPERLKRVRQLLAEEVQTSRRDRPDRSYLEILVDALDYRRWHRFEFTLFDASGAGRRLSKAAHSRLSGGEKAATLHLPLFAAAHAHFSAARSDCPRLVAMDEAFAGIDDTGVPELLRLAHAFDLDWFLTGYDLWITEPFLPAVMHYDLAHDPISRAVSAWPILWNGSETLEGDALSRAARTTE